MSTKKTAKTKAKTKEPVAGTLGKLIDRHGDDCGYILYSPYISEETILCLSDDAPRLITLKTWERWGKQAKSFQKAAKKHAPKVNLSRFTADFVVKKAAKKKAKKVTKKK